MEIMALRVFPDGVAAAINAQAGVIMIMGGVVNNGGGGGSADCCCCDRRVMNVGHLH